MIDYKGRRGRNHDRSTVVFEYVVDGRRVPVHVSTEAMEDHRETAALAVADRKLAAAAASGTVPVEVLVTNADFQ